MGSDNSTWERVGRDERSYPVTYVVGLEREIGQLRVEVERLSHGSMCAYCGHEESHDSAEARHLAMYKHIVDCEKNPTRLALLALMAAEREILRQYDAAEAGTLLGTFVQLAHDIRERLANGCDL